MNPQSAICNPQSEAPQSPATILVVEDYPPSRLALTAVLTAAHYRVVEAGDGVEALAILRAGHFDLIISDILMPTMDGYEFVRQLRGDPARAATPVIFMTATFDKPETRTLALACGVRHILAKPADPADILQTVTLALAEPPSAATPGPEFDHAHVLVLMEKLTKKMTELEARRASCRTWPILVVEDNPMDLDLLLQAFVEVKVANPLRICRDGEEALQFIADHPAPDDPDLPLLVLLDLRLPKVDGIEVLRLARQNPVWKQIPFIVVTTSRENADIARAYALGANSFIVKPVDSSAFVEVVKNIKAYWLLTNEPPFPKNERKHPA